MTNETQTATPAPDMVTMFSAALTEIINKMVDKRVNEIMENMITVKLMDNGLTERIEGIVEAAIVNHEQSEPHHEIEDAVQNAVESLDLDDIVDRTFRENVNWEDHVDEKVRSLVDDLVDDNVMHDKVREVLNEVTFTVSVD